MAAAREAAYAAVDKICFEGAQCRRDIAAKALRCDQIVVIGHMTDMTSTRRVLNLVGQYYSTPIALPEHGGYFTAIGALHSAAELP